MLSSDQGSGIDSARLVLCPIQEGALTTVVDYCSEHASPRTVALSAVRADGTHVRVVKLVPHRSRSNSRSNSKSNRRPWLYCTALSSLVDVRVHGCLRSLSLLQQNRTRAVPVPWHYCSRLTSGVVPFLPTIPLHLYLGRLFLWVPSISAMTLTSSSPIGGNSSASSPEAPPASALVLGPFQASRPSRASTVSAELNAPPASGETETPVLSGAGLPRSATADVHGSTGDSNAAGSGDPSTDVTARLDSAWWTYQPLLGSHAACSSCRRLDASSAPTQWFGSVMELSVPLPPHLLRYEWQQHAHSGVTVA